MNIANVIREMFPHRQHVYPINDTRQHVTNGGTCWCNPTFDGYVVIHNAADGREDYEVAKVMQ